MSPPDFRVSELRLAPGSNIDWWTYRWAQREKRGRLRLPDAATDHRSGCSCSSGGRVMLGSFSLLRCQGRACASRHAEKRTESTGNWLNASLVYSSAN